MTIPKRARRAALRLGSLALVALTLSCSSSSRLVLRITRIAGNSAGNLNTDFINADMIGSVTTACCLIDDFATASVSLDAPGTVGPRFGARLVGYDVDYYYFDPSNPAAQTLAGPVPDLKISNRNIRVPLTVGGTSTFGIPIVTRRTKMWAAGVSCANIPSASSSYPQFAAGGQLVRRMIAKVTAYAEDDTGKSLQADGNIMINLEDWAPGPTAPAAGAALDCNNNCYNDYSSSNPIQSYLSGFCY